MTLPRNPWTSLENVAFGVENIVLAEDVGKYPTKQTASVDGRVHELREGERNFAR